MGEEGEGGEVGEERGRRRKGERERACIGLTPFSLVHAMI